MFVCAKYVSFLCYEVFSYNIIYALGKVCWISATI